MNTEIEWLTIGYIESHTGPDAGPSSEHLYSVACVRPGSGPMSYGPLRLANVRWDDEWDTLPVPVGATCMVWSKGGRISAAVFGIAEQLADCGSNPGMGARAADGRTNRDGRNPPPPPPPGGGGTTVGGSAPAGGLGEF